MKAKHRRMGLVVLCVASMALGATMLLSVFQNNLLFFFSPTEVLANDIPSNQRIRVGGMVAANSIKQNGLYLEFMLTDFSHAIKVTYQGFPPSLFREGQGVVAEGYLENKEVFKAEILLAKHDENYMPPEVSKALKASGHWKQ